MLKTPLHDYHTQYGAQFVEYAGWEMPIRYTSIIEEHKQVRTSGGLFDVSHMGRLEIKGLHARRLLERVCTRRIGTMQQGQCRYSLICNEKGGVRDDVIVMRMDDDEFLMVVNAANREKIVAHLESVAADRSFKVKLDDRTAKTAMVALQGPNVMDHISRVSKEIPALKRYRFTVKNLVVLKLIVSRTGYTGEDGVEVIVPSAAVPMALKLLTRDMDKAEAEASIKPIGLGARDTLRLEAGMPLYGHELGEDIIALECGVDFAINLEKSEAEDGETFIGQEALLAVAEGDGPARKLLGIELDGRRTPRQGMSVSAAGGGDIGVVSSGCMSPTLDKPIAMAFIETSHAEPGASVIVDSAGKPMEGRLTALPFYTKPKS